MSATVTPQIDKDDCQEQVASPACSALQFAWVAMLHAHLAKQFHHDANAYVGQRTDNDHRLTPDVSVMFGTTDVRHEACLQVAFDVLTPGWRFADMQDKFEFYEKYGAEEYYILYPEFPAHAEGYLRTGTKLVRINEMNGYVSPRTGLRFSLETGQLAVFGRDGKPLRTAEEPVAERKAELQRQKATALATKLRELGIDPDAV